MPQGTSNSCASVTKYRLDRLAIRVLFSADDLRLEGERCWKLGLIVSELLTNVARHAQFGGRRPELRVELMLAGNIVKCVVSDNGSAPEPIRRGRGLTIIGELAGSLGGRVHTSCAAEGSSFLLTFPLTEAEQRAAGATRVVRLKRRSMRRPQRLETSRTEDRGVGWATWCFSNRSGMGSAVTSRSVPFPDLMRALPLRRLLIRKDYVRPIGTAGSDLLRKRRV
jgi:hypothetical protein